MYKLLYVEVNVICMIILLYILYKASKNIDKSAVTIAFNRVVLATLAILVIDITWMLGDKQPGVFFYWFNALFNSAYLFVAGLISYLWFIFVNYKIKSGTVSKKFQLLMAIPLALLFVLCVTSPWTKAIFYIDEQNAYTRGAYYVLHPIISYSYIVTASVQVFKRMKRTQARQQKSELLTLFSFFILPILGATLCIIIYGLPTSWPCTTLSLLMVYINLQSYQISTDALTELNNRRQFDKYIQSVTSDMRMSGRLFLFIMDIDDFKHINDTYGHPTGDTALINTARLLSEVCRGRDAFLARYGGDEFALLFFCEKVSEAKHLKTCIQQAFEQYNNTKAVPYKLTLSIGLGEFNSGSATTHDALIAKADEALYLAKAKHKQQAR